MKKYVYLLMMMCLAVALPSCGDDDEDSTIDEVWKQQNEQAFMDKAFDSAFTRLTALSNAGTLYYKQITPGNGKQVYYNSRVDVYYEGSYITGDVFYKKVEKYDTPIRIAVSSSVANYSSTTNPYGYRMDINGISEILQFMTEGEEGEVWIPQELGYGAMEQYNVMSVTVKMRPYSTLIYKIKIAKTEI